MPTASHADLRRDLLAWFAEHRRRLPWRHEAPGASNLPDPDSGPDPYAVWVSEIMLQQTRVETATPYFERWMARFPDLASLAAASLDEVLGLWQGLGYYSRARNLHAAARRVVDAPGGAIPRDARGLRRLPGIGDYAAGAIASIAFGEAVPAIDGNVRRVLSRLDALEGDPARGATAKAIRARASALVAPPVGGAAAPAYPGDVNQALMELGATVCKPRKPDCERCPLRAHCLALAHGRQSELPASSPRAAQRRERWLAFALMDPEGRWLLARRPEAGLLGGLWEFPMAREAPRQDPIRILRQAFGLRAAGELRAAEPVLHVFTHIRLDARPFVGRVEGGSATALPAPTAAVEVEARPAAAPAYPQFRWAAPAHIGSDALPVSTLMRKMLAAVDAVLEAASGDEAARAFSPEP